MGGVAGFAPLRFANPDNTHTGTTLTLSSRSRHKPRPLWHPVLWPGWVAFGCAWLLVRLPTHTLTRIGARLGGWFEKLAPSRRHIAATNLQLCFPQLDARERSILQTRVFESMGIALMETLWSWLGNKHNDPSHLERCDFVGTEVLEDAYREGKGVLLIGAHLMALDAIGPALSAAMHKSIVGQIDVIYRYNKNPLIERAMVQGRKRLFPNVIEREDAREILQSLKDSRVLWYAADQDYGAKHSVFADFFGVPAATITATARLARMRNSPVVVMSQYRDIASHRWQVRFEPGPEHFPTSDPVADARSINALIETAIQRAPEQYLWLHRRFKTRPEGEAKIY